MRSMQLMYKVANFTIDKLGGGQLAAPFMGLAAKAIREAVRAAASPRMQHPVLFLRRLLSPHSRARTTSFVPRRCYNMF